VEHKKEILRFKLPIKSSARVAEKTGKYVSLLQWLLTYAHLTAASVTLLLKQCKNLRTIGRLSGWDVRSWDSRRLQKAWNAYDVNLVLFSHKQEGVEEIIDAIDSSDEEQG